MVDFSGIKGLWSCVCVGGREVGGCACVCVRGQKINGTRFYWVNLKINHCKAFGTYYIALGSWAGGLEGEEMFLFIRN